MELTRNHYLIIGIILLGLGIQFRYVNTMVFNEPTTKWINETFGPPATQPSGGLFGAMNSITKRTYLPPPWLGWALVSSGAVIVLHSLAMNKPSS